MSVFITDIFLNQRSIIYEHKIIVSYNEVNMSRSGNPNLRVDEFRKEVENLRSKIMKEQAEYLKQTTHQAEFNPRKSAALTTLSKISKQDVVYDNEIYSLKNSLKPMFPDFVNNFDAELNNVIFKMDEKIRDSKNYNAEVDADYSSNFREAAKKLFDAQNKTHELGKNIKKDLALATLAKINNQQPIRDPKEINAVKEFFIAFAEQFKIELNAIILQMPIAIRDSKSNTVTSDDSQSSLTSPEATVMSQSPDATMQSISSQASNVPIALSTPMTGESKEHAGAHESKLEMAVATAESKAAHHVKRSIELFEKAKAGFAEILSSPGNRNYVRVRIYHEKLSYVLGRESDPKPILQLISNPNPKPNPLLESKGPNLSPLKSVKEVNNDPNYEEYKKSDRFKEQMKKLTSTFTISAETPIETIEKTIQEKNKAIEALEYGLSKGLKQDAEAFADYVYGLYSVGKLKLQYALRIDPNNQEAKQYLAKLEEANKLSLPPDGIKSVSEERIDKLLLQNNYTTAEFVDQVINILKEDPANINTKEDELLHHFIINLRDRSKAQKIIVVFEFVVFRMDHHLQATANLAFHYEKEKKSDSKLIILWYRLALCWYNQKYPGENNTAKYFLLAAEKGHADSMINLGLCYLYGYGGVELNVKKAQELFARAGTGDEWNRKAFIYKTKENRWDSIVEFNFYPEFSHSFFENAEKRVSYARRIFKYAQLEFAKSSCSNSCLAWAPGKSKLAPPEMKGETPEIQFEVASYFLGKSSCLDGIVVEGGFYRHLSIEYFYRAASNSHLSAQIEFSRQYNKGIQFNLSPNSNPTLIISHEAKKLADDWHKAAIATQKKEEAQKSKQVPQHIIKDFLNKYVIGFRRDITLGEELFSYMHVDEGSDQLEKNKVFSAFETAANSGYTLAQLYLAHYYFDYFRFMGSLFRDPYKPRIKYFDQCIRNSSIDRMTRRILMSRLIDLHYRYDRLVNYLSVKKRLPYLLLKAEQGDSQAQYILGCYHNEGNEADGIQIDNKKAIYYFNLAAKQNDKKATSILALFYTTGDPKTGISKDIPKAVFWMKEAVKYHDEDAKKWLINYEAYQAALIPVSLLDFRNKEINRLFENVLLNPRFPDSGYGSDFAKLKDYAKKGNANAQFYVGAIYEHAKNIGVYKHICIDGLLELYYRSAAAQDHAEAIERFIKLDRDHTGSRDEKSKFIDIKNEILKYIGNNKSIKDLLLRIEEQFNISPRAKKIKLVIAMNIISETITKSAFSDSKVYKFLVDQIKNGLLYKALGGSRFDLLADQSFIKIRNAVLADEKMKLGNECLTYYLKIEGETGKINLWELEETEENRSEHHKRYVLALSFYEEAEKLNPLSGYIQYRKGIVLFYLGRNEEALLCSEKAYQLDPQYVVDPKIKSKISQQSAPALADNKNASRTDASPKNLKADQIFESKYGDPNLLRKANVESTTASIFVTVMPQESKYGDPNAGHKADSKSSDRLRRALPGSTDPLPLRTSSTATGFGSISSLSEVSRGRYASLISRPGLNSPLHSSSIADYGSVSLPSSTAVYVPHSKNLQALLK